MAAVGAVGFCAVGCYLLGGKRVVLVGVLRVFLVGMKEEGRRKKEDGEEQ